MTPWDKNDDLAVHDDFVSYVSELLNDWEWKVRSDPQVGSVRPDLLAEAPDGRSFVFEIKTGEDTAHLGALGQLETYRDAVESQTGRKAEAILLLSDRAPEKLRHVADDIGVKIVGGFNDERVALTELLEDALSGGRADAEPDG